MRLRCAIMLKLASYDIVFQEIPDEVTLALSISNCPIRCKGCHSPHLMENIGEGLDAALLDGLIHDYMDEITCVCFMGGNCAPMDINLLARHVRSLYGGKYKIGWYSGRQRLNEAISLDNFDYIKLGPYMEDLGGLACTTTNQRMYSVCNGIMEDVTFLFRRKRSLL